MTNGVNSTQGSGRAQLTITKDTTLRISFSVLLILIGYIAVGTWQFFELRGAERDRVNSLISNININAAQYVANTNQQLGTLSSDLNYTSKTLDGYKSRVDRHEEVLQDIRTLRQRIDHLDNSIQSHERRAQSFESKFDEMQRKTAEHAIVIDYLMRWLNPPGTGIPLEPPKRRNNTPYKGGNSNNFSKEVLAR